MILNIPVYAFQYGVGAYFWAAVLDLKVKMVWEHNSNHSLRINFMMSELSENVGPEKKIMA